MTSKPKIRTRPKETPTHFPDFEARQDMQNWLYLYQSSFPAALAEYLGDHENTIAGSEIPLALSLSSWTSYRVPDMLVSYNADPELLIAQKGYAIDTQGKPPDFVLEVASPTTAVMDYTRKRREYEGFGVVEYWRFDPSGGELHDEALAGDRLVDGRFVPIETEWIDDEKQRGYSESLGLYLCWEEGELRWYNPDAGEYLQTYEEVTARAERAEAELRELRQRLEQRGDGEG